MDDNPLLGLVKRLISVTESETLKHEAVSNVQLVDILNSEFQIDTKEKTEFEKEVYLQFLKKYMKVWPRWDELGEIIKEKRLSKEKTCLTNILSEECVKLKEYLKEKLASAEKIMKHYNTKLQKKIDAHKKYENYIDSKEIEMEIVCTRSQLNNLIYKYPHKKTGTIFNVTPGAGLSRISMEKFNIKVILNWTNVQTKLLIPGHDCTRTNSSTVKLTLLNINSPENIKARSSQSKEIPGNIYYKRTGRAVKKIEKSALIRAINDLRSHLPGKLSTKYRTPLRIIFEEFLKDIHIGPSEYDVGFYRMPLNKFNFSRHMNVEPHPEATSVDEDLNLELEEILVPSTTIEVTSKILNTIANGFTLDSAALCNENLIRVDCLQCDVYYVLFNQYDELIQHFNYCHTGELDWVCGSCHRSVSMLHLVEGRWQHNCTYE